MFWKSDATLENALKHSYYVFEYFVKVERGLVYSEPDHEYWSDHPGVANTLHFNMTSQTTFDEQKKHVPMMFLDCQGILYDHSTNHPSLSIACARTSRSLVVSASAASKSLHRFCVRVRCVPESFDNAALLHAGSSWWDAMSIEISGCAGPPGPQS